MWHLMAIPASHHTTPYETVLVNTHRQRLCFLFENYMFKKKRTGGETFAKEAASWNWHVLGNCRLHRWPFRKSPSLPPRQRLKGGFLNQETESCWSPFPVNIKVSCKCNSSQRCLKEEREEQPRPIHWPRLSVWVSLVTSLTCWRFWASHLSRGCCCHYSACAINLSKCQPHSTYCTEYTIGNEPHSLASHRKLQPG